MKLRDRSHRVRSRVSSVRGHQTGEIAIRSLDISPNPVEMNERAVATIRAENLTDQTRNFEVTWLLGQDGQTFINRTATLGLSPGERDFVSLPHTPADVGLSAGDYSVAAQVAGETRTTAGYVARDNDPAAELDITGLSLDEAVVPPNDRVEATARVSNLGTERVGAQLEWTVESGGQVKQQNVASVAPPAGGTTELVHPFTPSDIGIGELAEFTVTASLRGDSRSIVGETSRTGTPGNGGGGGGDPGDGGGDVAGFNPLVLGAGIVGAGYIAYRNLR